MSTAIQKAEPSIIDTLVTPEWPRSVIDVVKRQVAPKGIPEDDFYVFMKKAQQSGLNPLTGEVYCIPRNTKGPDGKAVTIHTFQPSAEGMRTRAGRFPDFLGCDGGAVYEKDLVMMDQGKGEISHKSNPAAPRGALRGAWGRVTKKDGSRFLVWLPVGSRSGNSQFWAQDPGSMLRKCAIVAALREAYPVAFGGMYAHEEMDDAPPQPTRAEVVLSAVSGTPPANEAPALPAAGPVVEFGEWKGRPIVALNAEEKQAAIAYGQWQLEQNPKMKQKIKDALTENMQAIQSSLAASATPVEDAEVVEEKPLPISHPDAQPPEPGSEG